MSKVKDRLATALLVIQDSPGLSTRELQHLGGFTRAIMPSVTASLLASQKVTRITKTGREQLWFPVPEADWPKPPVRTVPICTATSKGDYIPANSLPARPGASDAFQIPSLGKY